MIAMRGMAVPLIMCGAAALYLGPLAQVELRGADPDAVLFTVPGADTLTDEAANALVQGSCTRCHNDRRMTGNLSLESFDIGAAAAEATVAERMIRKLRAGMMPPAGRRRPPEVELQSLATTLEARVDADALANPQPGRRTFQRLNQAEYRRAVYELLAMDVDAGAFLPPDTKSANFDNIADVQLLSPTLMDAYLRAAAEISRLAVGDAEATPSESTYRVPRWNSQMEHVEGTPYGTRGGVSVTHTFPADGEYRFRVSFHHETTGALFGSGQAALHTAEDAEQIEISVDGERVALMEIDRWMHVSDPDGVNLRTEPIFVRAGARRLSAAFLPRFEGPVQDLMSPHHWSIASTSIADAYGFTSLPHLRDLAVTGPFDVRGVSDTPSRARIFTCRPEPGADAHACAERIIARLGSKAYRRDLTESNLSALMGLYDVGATDGGFEAGVRMALEGILASPHFVFRFEEPSSDAGDAAGYRIADSDLASRLSFFLWSTLPDEELTRVAARGALSDPDTLDAQVARMLADPRAEALASRFAFQWLRLQDLEKIHPDVRIYPDFDQQLKDAMIEETQRFFDHLVREDRSILDLFTADYTFVNERLARHYGIPGVSGNHFRRVPYPDDFRRGILGHGSVLTLTSHAGRTSPVLRGKWIMEVLLGTPPPPPPPDVPELEATDDVADGRMLSVRERMEQHRSNPACNSCHRVIDPIGLALDNFDVTGAWRIKDNGVPIDAAGELYDGTPIASPADLRQALLRRTSPLVRTFTENLMAYALGRRVETYDMPSIREIERTAATDDYRVSSFVLGIVRSPAFQMKAPATAVDAAESAQHPSSEQR